MIALEIIFGCTTCCLACYLCNKRKQRKNEIIKRKNILDRMVMEGRLNGPARMEIDGAYEDHANLL